MEKLAPVQVHRWLYDTRRTSLSQKMSTGSPLVAIVLYLPAAKPLFD